MGERLDAHASPVNLCKFGRLEMKILVLGATGATGRLIVNRALAMGYAVMALSAQRPGLRTWLERNLSKVTLATRPR